MIIPNSIWKPFTKVVRYEIAVTEWIGCCSHITRIGWGSSFGKDSWERKCTIGWVSLSGNNSEKWVGTIWEKLDGWFAKHVFTFILHHGKLLKFFELEAKPLSSLSSQNGVLEKISHSGIETAHSPSPVEKEFIAHIPESTMELEVNWKHSVVVWITAPTRRAHSNLQSCAYVTSCGKRGFCRCY